VYPMALAILVVIRVLVSAVDVFKLQLQQRQ
jgi:hypothetical protein